MKQLKDKIKRFLHTTKGKIIMALSAFAALIFAYFKGKKAGIDKTKLEWGTAWHNWINDWWPSVGDRMVVERSDLNKVALLGDYIDASDEINMLKDTIKTLNKEAK